MADDRVKLEKNTKEDLLNKIKEYAKCFTPEWELSYEHPDAGSTLALLFAEQMAGNIELYNALVEEYHKQFIRMSGISFRPPAPAAAVVLVKLIEQSVPGLFLYSGTKFTAQGESEQEIIFESVSNLYLTEAVIDTILMKSREGQWSLILGKLKKPIIDGEEEILQESFRAFSPFSSEMGTDREHMLIIGHPFLFAGEKDHVRIKFAGGEELLKGIEEKKFLLYYYKDGEKNEIWEWEQKGEELIFPGAKIREDKKGSPCLIIQSVQDAANGINVEKILLSSLGGHEKPEFVCTDVKDCKTEEFLPFGDTLSVYAQCYIGSSHYFSKKGALICLEFDLETEEKRAGMQRKKEDDLRVIKKRDYIKEQEYVADAFAQEAVFEYYTGKGWKQLEMPEEADTVFQKGAGHVKLQFLCPKDWEPAAAGAYEGKCLRIRLTKAENCYYQPCIHHYPVVRNLKLSYDYGERYVIPNRLEKIHGFSRTDLMPLLLTDSQIPVFDGKRTDGKERIYLGFTKQLRGGPVSLWVQKGEEISAVRNICYYYYGKGAWKRLKVIDNTDDLTHAGTILFLPPADMEPYEFQGQKKYFLCMEKESGPAFLEKITDISFNGVDVRNQETGEEEEVYIDVSKPDMEFYLECRDLLSVEIWVNETGEFIEAQMKELLKKQPEITRVDYNSLGEIQNFYVRYEETNRFDNTDKERVYRLDRSGNRIIFGDGIHKRIPKITGDAAFKMIPCRCRGSAGNVAAGQINDTRANILFVDSVSNPLPAFGGSSIESAENLLTRGTGLLSSHARLITEEDYVREIRAFSGLIRKVRCVGIEDKLYIIILMKDYREGCGSFYKIKKDLQEYIEKRCEIAIPLEKIVIAEPVFVEIHISVWLKAAEEGDTFGMTVRMKERLEDYLDPVKGKNGLGWEIGSVPQHSQLIMQINTLKEKAAIKRVLITASYKDETGIHECALEKLREHPLAVIKSGEHHIYTE